ncbi:MAG: hypothetical protein WC538_06425 [Thermoanaerobaculia bacterium]
MRIRIAVALLPALLVAGLASAQTSSGTTAASTSTVEAQLAAPANESPLVKAAKDAAAASAKRGNKPRLSINDKDVKKSAGKLIETTSKPLPPVRAADDVETRMRAEKAAKESKGDGKKLAAGRVAASEKQVAELESELRRIEETYYDEDDPDFREDVIEKRFNETKAKLEKARQELEAARTAEGSAGPTTP